MAYIKLKTSSFIELQCDAVCECILGNKDLVTSVMGMSHPKIKISTENYHPLINFSKQRLQLISVTRRHLKHSLSSYWFVEQNDAAYRQVNRSTCQRQTFM
jgi:hypothetical protein